MIKSLIAGNPPSDKTGPDEIYIGSTVQIDSVNVPQIIEHIGYILEPLKVVTRHIGGRLPGSVDLEPFVFN